MRFWYLVTVAGAQVQDFCASPYQPHEQGYTQKLYFTLFDLRI
jgi:hypothetical protein